MPELASCWLAFDTSSRRSTIVLKANGQLFDDELEPEAAHASDLLPRVQGLLQSAGCAPTDLDVIAFGTGPGSYTGLRVGAATALGLSRSCDAELVGVPSIAALAHGALASAGESCVVVQDARAGGFYFAQFDRNGSELEEAVAPCVLSPEDIELERIAAASRVLTDAPSIERFGLNDRANGTVTLDARVAARDLLELAERAYAQSGASSPAELEPLYLRSFAAKRRKR